MFLAGSTNYLYLYGAGLPVGLSQIYSAFQMWIALTITQFLIHC